MPGEDAAAALGLTLQTWWATVSQCPWFAVTGKGWVLTEFGRADFGRTQGLREDVA